MDEITYESIKPYILEEKFDGSKCYCVFEVEGEQFEAKSQVKTTAKQGSAKIVGNVKRLAIGRGRSVIMRVVRRAVGGGFAATAASQAGNETIRQATSGVNFTRAEKEAAVIKAFESIAFELVNKDGKWALATEFSEFEKIVRSQPLQKPYDKKILARLLVEVARADGNIAQEEKDFFEGFLNEETGNLGSLMRAPAVSMVECEEVSDDAKGLVYMVTAAVAYADHSLADEEKIKLDDYAEYFEFKDKDKQEYIRLAQDYTIENLIRDKGRLTREELYEIADNIGMDRGEAERAQIKVDKRGIL